MDLSRSKTLDGIYITDFDENKIRTDPKVVAEMARLSTEQPMPSYFVMQCGQCISVSLLNARSARLHFMDVRSHPLLRKGDIVCLTETNILDEMDNKSMICLGYSPADKCHGLAQK